jgi:hypothetical protein
MTITTPDYHSKVLMTSLQRIFASLFFAAIAFVPVSAAVYSDLWGNDGEKWSPTSRLPDVSYAGYRCGEQPMPALAIKANVRDFGAKGDSIADDTKAFNDAIAATASGAILVPAGVYKITNFVTINKPNIVLRGEGSGKSVLWFPLTLTDVKPDWGATTTGETTSNYSWAGGYLVISGSYNQNTLASITAVAKRGDTLISVSTIAGFSKSQWVCIQAKDDAAKSLSTWLYNNSPGSITSLAVQTTRMVSRISAIDTATKQIRIERPLRFETRAAWTPVVQSFNPTVSNSGIEELGFKFPKTAWLGEFTELGYNAIRIQSAAHCWVRNVQLTNAEGGIFCNGMFCTITGVVLTATKPPYTTNKYLTAAGCTGHHGISVGGTDNLIADFDFQMSYVHDISVEGAASSGNVFSNGKGDDLCFDNHKKVPYANVFTNLDCGAGNRIWRCGGGSDLGLNCGGWSTWWNIRAAKSLSYPPATFGPWSINLVGVTTTNAQSKVVDGKWFETMKPADLVPQNIFEAQQTKRLGLLPTGILSANGCGSRNIYYLPKECSNLIRIYSLSGKLVATISDKSVTNSLQIRKNPVFLRLSAGLYLCNIGFDTKMSRYGLLRR